MKRRRIPQNLANSRGSLAGSSTNGMGETGETAESRLSRVYSLLTQFMDNYFQDEEKRRRFETLFPDPRLYANQTAYNNACRAHYRKFGVPFDMDATYRAYALWLDARHS
jgi:hypothetical protein